MRSTPTDESAQASWKESSLASTAEPQIDFWQKSNFVLWHVNIRGLISHRAELTARIRMAKKKPQILCLNETFLDASVKDGVVEIEGYSIVGRRDRRDGRKCGGVAVYVQSQMAASVTLMQDSDTHERLWILVHSDLGPFLIASWYRPPEPGEVKSISTLREEWSELSREAIGTIITGDMNVHHRKWLRRSARNSVEGDELQTFCVDVGMQQLVKDTTREDYLLDLVLTDVDGVKCNVLPQIADHSIVQVHFELPVPCFDSQERMVWKYPKADWDALREELAACEWDTLESMSADAGAEFMTRVILQLAEKYIPRCKIRDRKSTHLWINERVVELVKQKYSAAGTPGAAAASKKCSDGMRE